MTIVGIFVGAFFLILFFFFLFFLGYLRQCLGLVCGALNLYLLPAKPALGILSPLLGLDIFLLQLLRNCELHKITRIHQIIDVVISSRYRCIHFMAVTGKEMWLERLCLSHKRWVIIRALSLHHVNFSLTVFLKFVFWATSSGWLCIWESFLAGLGDSLWVPGIKPRSDTCKTSALPIALLVLTF